jgi:hypothetical protein
VRVCSCVCLRARKTRIYRSCELLLTGAFGAAGRRISATLRVGGQASVEPSMLGAAPVIFSVEGGPWPTRGGVVAGREPQCNSSGDGDGGGDHVARCDGGGGGGGGCASDEVNGAAPAPLVLRGDNLGLPLPGYYPEVCASERACVCAEVFLLARAYVLLRCACGPADS